MTTYISKLAKNGKMQYFRVDENGKKKIVKRSEYEANMSAVEQVNLVDMEPVVSVDESTATFAEIEIADNQSDSAEPEYTSEPIPARSITEVANNIDANIIENPFDFVKAAVESVIGRYKLTYKEWKKYGSVYYRSCAICGFDFDDNGNVTTAKFMGVTLESRKMVTERKIESLADWQYIKESALRQIEFVNDWWNPVQKSA